MELTPGMVTVYGAPAAADRALVPSLVQEGLTAQLVKQSFVTGLLSVELAFRPGAEVSRFGDATLPEVPTVPGDLEGLAKQLQTVDIAAVLESLQRTLAAAEAVLSNPGLGQAVGELPEVMRSLKRTLGATSARSARARLLGSARRDAHARDDARSRQRHHAGGAARTIERADTTLDAATPSSIRVAIMPSSCSHAR